MKLCAILRTRFITENANTPRFEYEEGEGDVFIDPVNKIYSGVEYDPGGKWLAIYHFTSNEPGQGNAQRSLQWLRRRFKHIVVFDIGKDESFKSWKFWVKMAQRGLVDELYPDDERITPLDINAI